MNIEKEKKSKENFLQISETLLATPKLTLFQKMIIARVLAWQKNEKVCFESNKRLAKGFGMSLSALKKQITVMNKFDFFQSNETSKYNEYGKWENSKQMKVNKELLDKFLLDNVNVAKKPKAPTKNNDKKTIVVENANTDKSDVVIDNQKETIFKTVRQIQSYLSSISKNISDDTIKNMMEMMNNVSMPLTQNNINNYLQMK
jgi:hypothetical protein